MIRSAPTAGRATEHLRATFGARRVVRSSAMAFERISVDPGQMGGLPCIRGMRVTVSALVGQLAAGRTLDEVLADYPYLEREDILAALEYAAPQ